MNNPQTKSEQPPAEAKAAGHSYSTTTGSQTIDFPNIGCGKMRTVGGWIVLMLMTEDGNLDRADILNDVMDELGITTEHLLLKREMPDCANETAWDEWERKWDDLENARDDFR